MGGNPVPVQADQVLMAARAVRQRGRDLRDWRRDSLRVFGRTGSVWSGEAAAAYAAAGTTIVQAAGEWDDRFLTVAAAMTGFASDIAELTARAKALVLLANSHAGELGSVKDRIEQIRLDYVAAERRAVTAVREQLGRQRATGPGSEPAVPRVTRTSGAGREPYRAPNGVGPASTAGLLATMTTSQLGAMIADLGLSAAAGPAPGSTLAPPSGSPLRRPSGPTLARRRRSTDVDALPPAVRVLADDLMAERDRRER